MFTMQMTTLFIVLFATLSSVSAHGFVSQIAIDGKWYAGNKPTLAGGATGPSPIRQISDISPVKGSSNPDLVCGLSAQTAALVVPANPGSVFSVQWVGGEDGNSNWPHNTGPLMTYMASCGSTPCNEFNGTGAEWFKIDELGQEPSGSTWYQADLMNGDAYEVTLPQNLAPGGYLIRHEIIALQLAVSLGGAEFYPMCTQVMIGGSGNGVPSPTVSFPGAYSDTDPGILDPNVYNPGSNYTFPGGPISNLAGSNQQMVTGVTAIPPFPSGTNVGSAAPAPTESTPAASSSAAGNSSGSDPSPSTSASGASSSATGSSSTCKLRARSAGSTASKRHFKRVRRGAMPHASH